MTGFYRYSKIQNWYDNKTNFLEGIMTKFVIATHGYFAKGLKMSTEFIMGKQKDLFAICAYTPECKDFPQAVQTIINNSKDDIVFGTDIVGGSVNTDLQKIVASSDRLHLVAGINLPFLLQFLTSNEKNVSDAINKSIEAAKEGIVNFDNLNTETSTNALDDFDSF